MFRIDRWVLLLLLGLASCAPATQTAPAPQQTPVAAASGADAIVEDAIRGHVAFLASDELLGRATPSPGLERAAEYIADHFESIGLQPAGDDGSFFQRFPLPSMELDPEAMHLRIEGADSTIDLTYRSEFAVMGSELPGATGQLVVGGSLEQLVSSPAAFADNIALIHLAGAPGPELMTVGESAAAAGASAVIVALSAMVPPQALPQLASFLETGTGSGQPVPVVLVSDPVAQRIVATAGGDYAEIIAGTEPSDPLDGTADLQVPVEISESNPPNVAAVLPGSDPALKDTYVILTAHFDHVGVGTPDETGDSIYNGADDDASGTSVVMEVAAALAALPEAPARSIIFLTVSGEELGLLGSMHYAQNPTVPVESIVANINMDMVGRNAPDSLVVIGDDYTTLGELTYRVAQDNADLGLNLMPDPDPSENVFFRSDHFSFAAEGIPAIFFTTWLHEDYHQPSDELEVLDTEKLTRVAKLVYHVTREVADSPVAPDWTEAGEAAMAPIWAQQ